MDIKKSLREFITENFLFNASDNTFADDDSFLESGIIDSTGILELVSFIEENYRFDVLDEELVPDNFDSLDKLASYVSNKTGAPA